MINHCLGLKIRSISVLKIMNFGPEQDKVPLELLGSERSKCKVGREKGFKNSDGHIRETDTELDLVSSRLSNLQVE